MDIALKQNADWQAAAGYILSGCAVLNSVQDRVRLFEQIASELGDHLYPAFIQILCTASQCNDESVKKVLVEALVEALRSGRMPAGGVSAWGATHSVDSNAFGKVRYFGPLEYLCVWYAQPNDREVLSELHFRSAIRNLLSLINLNPNAKTLYLDTLNSDLKNSFEGRFSSGTRVALESFSFSWANEKNVDAPINAFLSSLATTGQQTLSHSVDALFSI